MAWINFGTSEVWCRNSGGTEPWEDVDMYAPGELEWKATVGGKDAQMDEENGTISIEVNNTKGFRLPQTGGSGTLWFLVGGGVVVLAAIAVIVTVTRKKGSRKAE